MFGDRLYISKSLPYFLELAAPERDEGDRASHFVAEQLGLHARAGRRVRRRRERRRAARVGRLRRRGRRTRTSACSRSPTSSARPRRRKASRRCSRPLLDSRAMIDVRAARSDPDGFRAALARKGAGEAFDELMAADARWRELVPQVDELRAKTKLKGKPTPEQLEELQRREGRAEARSRRSSRRPRRARDEALAQRARTRRTSRRPTATPRTTREELRRWGEPPQLAEPKEHTEIGRFEMERAARVSGSRFGYLRRRHRAARARALPLRARPARQAKASRRCCRRCSCARRRCTARASSRPSARTSTRSRATTST